MSSEEKIEMLKDTIQQLYSNEGRSKNYISKLLKINRQKLSNKINEWNLPVSQDKKHLTPSTQKFLNKNRNLIKSRLDKDVSVYDISIELKVNYHFLIDTLIKSDDCLTKSYEDFLTRKQQKKERKMDESFYEYNIVDLPDEQWQQILGFPLYYVSNMGRIKKYCRAYDSFYLIKPQPNCKSKRLYVNLSKDNKKTTMQLSRIVAHAFVAGYSEKDNTVNHINGDVADCKASNLEWISQSENNKHAYRELHRAIGRRGKSKFKKIIYQDKYEFKTVAALARFIGKSETQTWRYLKEPEKHDIKIIR